MSDWYECPRCSAILMTRSAWQAHRAAHARLDADHAKTRTMA